MQKKSFYLFSALLGASIFLSACQDGSIRDFRGDLDNLKTTSSKATKTPESRPQSDKTEPASQLIAAKEGDTPRIIAARIGVDAESLAAYNNMAPDTPLRKGELVIIPADKSASSGVRSSKDVTSIAQDALARTAKTAAPAQTTNERQSDALITPLRHRVEPGETVYSIAALYNISPKALVEWNALGPNLTLRVGQSLLIPVVSEKSLESKATPAFKTELDLRPTPRKTTRNTFTMIMPAAGTIKRGFKKGEFEGLDIAVAPGGAVYAVADGEVAAITRNTDGVVIIIIRHSDEILTIYEFVEDISVKKGDKVRKGQNIAVIKARDPGYLHFELRKGFEAIDPNPYLQN